MQWNQIPPSSLQLLCLFLLLPLPLTLPAALTLSLPLSFSCCVQGIWTQTCQRKTPLKKRKCKMKQFCSLFTPRLFDPPFITSETSNFDLDPFPPNSFSVRRSCPPRRDVSPRRHLQPFQKFTGQCDVRCVTVEAEECPIILAWLAVSPKINKTLMPAAH